MKQSWVVYNISNGKIICYGREIDIMADQALINQGDNSCALYMIQQLCQDPDVSVLYCDCGDVDPLSGDLKEIDHDLQEIVDMPLADIKVECKKLANHDIIDHYRLMIGVKNCIERIQNAVPDEAIIQTAINDWLDNLEASKIVIDGQISALSTPAEALQYYGSRAWLQEFPATVEWEDM